MRGRTTSRTLPMGQRERFTYDVAGQLKTHTDFLGRTTGYDYDPMGRETLRDYPGDADVTFTYTASGQLKTHTDGRGTTTYHYDDRDRLARIDYPDGQWIGYDYDAAGHRSLVRTPHGTTGYGHDALGRLERITDAQGETIISYTPVGTREQVNYPNGVSTSYGYDTRHRLKRLVTRNAVGATLLGLTYALNPTGTRAAIHEDAGRSVTYTYDALQRLETETVSDPVLGNRQVTWTYDAVGNRRTETRDGQLTTYTYDANDRLSQTSGPGGTTTYTHDANGNTQTEIAPGGLTTYAWNEANRLIGATLPGGSALSYTYDPHGIRQSATVDGQTTRYLVDPNRDYAEVIAEVDQGTNTLIATYSHGDDLISQTRGGLTSYAHADGLGSVRLLTDATGNNTDSYVYEAFGEVEDRQGTSENPYQFTGEQHDPHLDQTYLRARYYDAGIGRFTSMDSWVGNSRDPISLNKYLYADGNPVNKKDPSGMMSLGDFGVAQNIQGILRSSFPTVSKRGLDIARKAKVFDVYAYATLWPTHFYMYAQKIRSTSGIRYDVGAPGGWGNLRRQLCRGNLCGIMPGFVQSAWVKRSSLEGRGKKIVSLTFPQWLLWHSTVVGTEEVGCTVELTYGFVPGTTNCLSWTIGATAKAVFISRFIK